jgi:uncharacterized protein (UPF0335 family)
MHIYITSQIRHRSEGLAVINLRTFIADTIEVMESTGKDLIADIREQINDLKASVPPITVN